MDATQLYIIKQSCLNRATDLYSKTDNWNEEQILETANIFVEWVTGEENTTALPPFPLPRLEEDKRNWLNFNSPDYNKALGLVRKGYTVKDLRTHYKVRIAVADELNKYRNNQ